MTTSSTQLSRFTAILACGTMLSRVLGLVRDMVWAVVPTGSREAFIVAFKLPNMLRELVGEGALNAAFVPVFSETMERQSEEGFRDLVRAAMFAMLLLLGILTVLGVVFVPVLLQGMNALQHITGGPERTPEELGLLVTLARWTFPYLFFIGMAVFFMGALFTVRHYTTPSWSPALLNVAIIASCLLFRHRFADPAYALVIGVWLGGMAQVVAMYIALGRRTGVWLPGLRLTHPGLRVILLLMGPVILGQAAGEVNKLVDTLFAYSRGEGTVTALYYANRLVQLPLSVFGFATAAAILPAASAAAARQDTDAVRTTIMQGLRQTLFLVLPAMFGLIVLGEPIVRLLFERGASFTAEDTHRTAIALAIYAAGLIAFAGVKVVVSGFYAVQDTKTPVLVSSASMLLNILLNCALVGPLGYAGLAVATSISFSVNFTALYILLGRRFGVLRDSSFVTALLRISTAAFGMACIAAVVYVRVAALFEHDSFTARLTGVALPVAAGALAYLGLCWFFRVDEFGHFAALLKRKLPNP